MGLNILKLDFMMKTQSSTELFDPKTSGSLYVDGMKKRESLYRISNSLLFSRMPQEFLDLVDENNIPTGEVKLRTEIHHEKKDWHRTVSIWIVNNQ